MTIPPGIPLFQGGLPTATKTIARKPSRTKIRDFAYSDPNDSVLLHQPTKLQKQGSTKGIERDIQYWRTHPDEFEKRGVEIRETGTIARLIKEGKWQETPEQYNAITLREYRRAP